MIHLSFRSGPPMIVEENEIVRVLLPEDQFERRLARLLAVGDIVQARGRIRSITSFEAAHHHDLVNPQPA